MHSEEYIIALVIDKVINDNRSLRDAIKMTFIDDYTNLFSVEQRGLIHALSFETIRWLNLVNNLLNYKLNMTFLLNKLGKKNKTTRIVLNLIRLAIYRMKISNQSPSMVKRKTIDVIKSMDLENVLAEIERYLSHLENLNLKSYLNSIKDKKQQESLKFAHPYWFIEIMRKQLDEQNFLKLMQANNSVPSSYIRINNLIKNVDIITRLQEEGLKLSKDEYYSDIYQVIDREKPLPRLESYKKGFFFIQSRSSAIIPHLLRIKEAQSILSACAAPGAKLTQIASLVSNRARIVAVELNQNRFNEMNENLKKYNVSSVETLCKDVNNLGDRYLNYFDRILLDVPCTGSGTFNSRPEGKWRISRYRVKYYVNLQKNLIKNVSKYLKKGGYMVYSTCSILPQENENVIHDFLTSNQNFKSDELTIPGAVPILRNGKRLYPYIKNSEGFSAFLVRRKK